LSFQYFVKGVHYEAFLPDDMKDLVGNKRVEKKIFHAWFDKLLDSDEFNYPPTMFFVTLDHCLVKFERDQKLSGVYLHGERRGQSWCVIKGTVVKYGAKRLLDLNRLLNHVANSMNQEIILAEQQRNGSFKS
jgi:hypothetical protein